jgi:sortase A
MALIVFSAAAFFRGRIYSRMSLTRFHSTNTRDSSGGPLPSGASSVDTSLWSEKRIHEYQATLAEYFDQPLGVLRIERIHLDVPVFNGTDERILNRGVGRILGTARVGEGGNIGIAGHRDGFFRGLKDIEVGDTVQLESREGTQTYAIDWIKIVSPNDVGVLREDGTSALTLVTFFPFYYIGSAPQRYIVHAVVRNASNPEIGPLKASYGKQMQH